MNLSWITSTRYANMASPNIYFPSDLLPLVDVPHPRPVIQIDEHAHPAINKSHEEFCVRSVLHGPCDNLSTCHRVHPSACYPSAKQHENQNQGLPVAFPYQEDRCLTMYLLGCRKLTSKSTIGSLPTVSTFGLLCSPERAMSSWRRRMVSRAS